MLKWLYNLDVGVARTFGDRRGRTVSAVAGDAIAQATGCSRQTGKDVFHGVLVGMAGVSLAVAASRLED